MARSEGHFLKLLGFQSQTNQRISPSASCRCRGCQDSRRLEIGYMPLVVSRTCGRLVYHQSQWFFIFPHIFVWGSCFWLCTPVRSSCLLLPPPSPARAQLTHTQITHNSLTHKKNSLTTQLTHTQLSHTQLTHTQLTHTQLTHTHLSHTTPSYATCSHTTLSHKTPSHTTPSHTTFSPTQLVHTQLTHTQLVHRQLTGRCDTWRQGANSVAGVAFCEMC